MTNISSKSIRRAVRVALRLSAALFCVAISQTQYSVLLAQRAERQIDPSWKIERSGSDSLTGVDNSQAKMIHPCEQKITDLRIVRRSPTKYEFRFQTACPAYFEIEFCEKSPVSTSPPAFGGKCPSLTQAQSGAFGVPERTEHDMTVDLLPDKKTDYFIIKVDPSGNPVYKAGALSLDSVEPGSLKITPIDKLYNKLPLIRNKRPPG